MLARVASNLFWLNRYLQRVENTSRLIRIHANLLMDLPSADPAVSWLPLVSITGGDKEFSELGSASDEISVCNFLISDLENPGSLASNLNVINANLRSSRDCMSTDLFEAIKNLCNQGRTRAVQNLSTNSRQDLLKYFELQSLAITGAMSSTISRDTGYLFLRAGGLLERADMTTRILDVHSANLLPVDGKSDLVPFENLQWVSVLRSLSAFQMYMKHVKKPVNGSDALSYLLQNRQLPHAFHYCLSELTRCIDSIEQNNNNVHNPSAIPQLTDLIETVKQADIALLAKNKQQLHEFIDQLQIALIDVSGVIASRYFPPLDLKSS